MRLAMIAAVAVLGCSEPTYTPKPLPALVASRPPGELAPIAVDGVGFAPGERFIWVVRVRGFAVGNVELSVTDSEIRSHFATSSLAHLFASIEHDLTTTFAGTHAQAALERLAIDGKVRQFSNALSATSPHSLHTALGALRQWARRGAMPGFMQVSVADQTVRVELGEPSGGKDWTKVDGKLVGLDEPASFTCWLDASQTLTHIEIRSGLDTVTADLLR